MKADQQADARRERCHNLNLMKYQLEDQIRTTEDEKAAGLLRQDYREIINELQDLEKQFRYRLQ